MTASARTALTEAVRSLSSLETPDYRIDSLRTLRDPELPNLKSLHLCHVLFTSADVVSLVEKHSRQLTELWFEKCNFQSGPEHLDFDRWQTVFKGLAKLKLPEALDLYCDQEVWDDVEEGNMIDVSNSWMQQMLSD